MGDESFSSGEFAESFMELLHDLRRLAPRPANDVRELVAAHLGVDPSGLPTLIQGFDEAEHPNLQQAINTLTEERPWELIALTSDHYFVTGFSIGSVLSAPYGDEIRRTEPEYVNRPISCRETLSCLVSG